MDLTSHAFIFHASFSNHSYSVKSSASSESKLETSDDNKVSEDTDELWAISSSMVNVVIGVLVAVETSDFNVTRWVVDITSSL